MPFKPLSWPFRLRIIKGLAKGLAHLHEYSPKKYVHGNLKPSNVLLGHKMETHISDFGLRRLLNTDRGFKMEETTKVTPQRNSPYEFLPTSPTLTVSSSYQAPEASKSPKPSQKWDVYSYGVILLEIICGKFPVIKMGSQEIDLVQWIQLAVEERTPFSHILDPFMAHDSDNEEEIVAAVKIALACVDKSPERRPSMRYVSDYLERWASSTYEGSNT